MCCWIISLSTITKQGVSTLKLSNDGFFNIPCDYQMYVEPLSAPASDDLLTRQMPENFKLLREIAEQEQEAFLHINQLPKGDVLTNYLRLQSKKTDLVLHHQLLNIPHQGLLCQGTHFGGSHLTFKMDTAFQPQQQMSASLLIAKHLVAVYCFIEILESDRIDDQHEFKAEIIKIGEAEQEQLIKASLSQQQYILQKRRNH